MKSDLLVSVLINNYNYGRFIGEAVESVLSQTYQKWELIIVDDGSSDDSVEVAESFKNKYPEKIQVISKDNGGQASAFNAGVSAARGDIIAFLDSDDYWYADKLLEIVRAHEGHGFVGHAKHYSNDKKEDANLLYLGKRHEFLTKYGFMNNMGLFTSTISLTRALAKKIFPMPEEDFRVSADYYVVIFALYYTGVCYLERELSYYRIHGENLYMCNQDIFGATESMVAHFKRMDENVRSQINERLRARGEDEIPLLTLENRNLIFQETDHPFSLKPGGSYILYGTGSKAIKYEQVLKEAGAEVIGYADSNESRWGSICRGRPVFNPSFLADMRDTYDKILIASVYYKEISEKLDKLGFLKEIDYAYAEIGI